MQFKTTPTIIDIEASGFGFNSFPIEVGIVKSDGGRYCSLVKPEEDWTYWSQEAEDLHGIKKEILIEKGKRSVQIASEINTFLNGETCYSDAWVHDKAWLNKLFHAARIKMEFTFSPLESLMTEQQHAIWDKQKLLTTAELQLARHRASTDAYIIQRTFLESKLNTQKRIV